MEQIRKDETRGGRLATAALELRGSRNFVPHRNIERASRTGAAGTNKTAEGFLPEVYGALVPRSIDTALLFGPLFTLSRLCRPGHLESILANFLDELRRISSTPRV